MKQQSQYLFQLITYGWKLKKKNIFLSPMFSVHYYIVSNIYYKSNVLDQLEIFFFNVVIFISSNKKIMI